MSMLRRENKKRHLFALFIRTLPGKDRAHDIVYLSLPRSVSEQYSRVANSFSRVSGRRAARASHDTSAPRFAQRSGYGNV
jgi:hypothetical protein